MTAIIILEKINFEIIMFQDDSKPISDVFECFIRLRKDFKVLVGIEAADRIKILQFLESRWNFVYHDIHAISYLLDPRYLGRDMSLTADGTKDFNLVLNTRQEIMRRSRLATAGADVDNAFEAKFAGEWNSFQLWVRERPEDFLAVKEGESTVLAWWILHDDQFPMLSVVATQVFSCVTSSAASERNFSAFGFINNKLRNKLNEKTTVKLVYVYANGRELGKYNNDVLDASLV